MHILRVPQPLRRQLGEDATVGLLDTLEESRKEWTADVTALVAERFERRLVEEASKVRVDMAEGLGVVRRDMADGFGAVRREMADQRVEFVRWAFLFWVGQFFAVAGLLAVVLRVLRS
jgi:hypothetical protein